jgi:hypothetical protein
MRPHSPPPASSRRTIRQDPLAPGLPRRSPPPGARGPHRAVPLASRKARYGGWVAAGRGRPRQTPQRVELRCLRAPRKPGRDYVPRTTAAITSPNTKVRTILDMLHRSASWPDCSWAERSGVAPNLVFAVCWADECAETALRDMCSRRDPAPRRDAVLQRHARPIRMRRGASGSPSSADAACRVPRSCHGYWARTCSDRLVTSGREPSAAAGKSVVQHTSSVVSASTSVLGIAARADLSNGHGRSHITCNAAQHFGLSLGF